MRLTSFIRQQRKEIVAEWIKFAGSLLPWAKGMSEKALRDHAEELLTAVVSDMEAPQSSAQQSKKSRGKAAGGLLAKIGHEHASERLETGFNLEQLVSEYRALRASILRLWEEKHGEKQADITRFNEAIDESLAEATMRYSEILEQTREQFLAILGHDLRTPLAAIVMGATLLTQSESLSDKEARVAARILNSAGRMDRMVHDLLDFARTRLGAAIPVTAKPMDLGSVCEQVIAELEAVHPDADVRFESKGDLVGEWDSDRLTQVITNLIANALQYGAKDKPVIVVAQGRETDVSLRVHNEGSPIPKNALAKVFEPMVRLHRRAGDAPNASGLGLGLYIAHEVVLAHGGTLVVASTQKAGTTFTAQIPRHPPIHEQHEHRRRSTDAK